ncbi:NUDIX domain-containing protein [Amorphoplanes digitatis]|uniref:8-oxo-dGTP pyrophosphatase MutT (NUDIX family) n=1 Tax=Actinoplanes digitatis TaxID=1868 RepID=A0A7W7MT77_9ACTN|nr:NUDIX domain-containing protein [Actinoplanes digitatis]MBB4766101.1 8-oxo-dGTP pyrophosphatase MutT (NUDIX family) [Actinoplanes digitatis]
MPISPYIKSLREVVGHRPLLLPGVTAVVFDDAGRLLLGQRSDNGRWALVAGVMDPGEQPAETVVREVYEETAVHVVPERVTSVLTQPPNTYPNGDQTEFVDITFRCRAVGGEARVNDDESLAVGWFGLADLPPISELARQRIEWALLPGPGAWFSAPAVHSL